MSQSKIIIERKMSLFIGSAKTYKVELDNIEVGKLSNGKTLEVETTHGDHILSFFAFGKRETSVSIHINENDVLHLITKIKATNGCLDVYTQTGQLLAKGETMTNCLLCEKTGKITKNTIFTSRGNVCPNCMKLLAKSSIYEATIDEHDVDVLKVACGYLNLKRMIIKSQNAPEEKIEMLIEKTPSISLLENEVCFYQEKAKAYHEKNVVTGRTGTGAGVSFRVAKGVSIRTGGGSSQVVRGNISEEFDGTLYITNFRIVLLAPKYGFDLHISKITQLLYKTNGFQVYSGSKCFSVLTDDINTVQELILFMNEHRVFKDEKIVNKKTTKTTTTSGKQDIETLREFKKLLDEGIITEDEFETKKKQLLRL